MASAETLWRRLLLDDWPANRPAPEITANPLKDPVSWLRQWQARYYYRPDLFAAEVLGEPLDPGQYDIAIDVANGHREISVRSGVGAGKTRLAAVIAAWFVATRNPAKVVVTAPGAPQLHDAFLPELKTLFRRLPPWLRQLFEVKSDRIELREAPEEVFISARTASADRPEIMQGVHSENILLIVDEASGIRDETLVAALGVMSAENATLLMISNPTRLLGFFADSHRKPSFAARFRKHHLSYQNSPRVSSEYVSMIAARYGEDSNEYRVRVLGDFPDSDVDSFIPLRIVELAMDRDIVLPYGRERVWGLDVARSGDDDCALCERVGPVVPWIEGWHGNDLMATTGRLVAKWEATPIPERPVAICIDVIGIGAGVADRAKELDLPVRMVNVSESPSIEGRYYNQRAELYDQSKEWLRTLSCKLPKNERLLRDAIGPRYEYTSNGRLKIESKESMRARGLDSPDYWDAVILTFAVKSSIIGGPRSRRRRGRNRRIGVVS